MTVSPFPGNGLFFDPLAGPAAPSARMQAAGPEVNGKRGAGGKSRRQAPHVDDERALRAASLRKVSRDLEHLLRQRGH
ncbi:hypothetical protein [Pseudarthrobacter sp. CCNWLW207]|uniref:hypothetical protein n=1 Tax=Pseudarthrobacter sp. CCNWLW207 TaxID=3127468 RepID=UPI0030786AF8